MTAVAMWHVNCDAGPERSPDCWWMTEDADTQGEAQQYARSVGWLVGKRGDDNLCPECRKVLGR